MTVVDAKLSRRALLQGGGALVIGFILPMGLGKLAAQPPGGGGPPPVDQICAAMPSPRLRCGRSRFSGRFSPHRARFAASS